MGSFVNMLSSMSQGASKSPSFALNNPETTPDQGTPFNPQPTVQQQQPDQIQQATQAMQGQQQPQQQSDPIEQLKQQFAQQAMQQTPPASGGGVKRFLQNWFHDWGQGMLASSGMPTEASKRQQALMNLNTLTQTQTLGQMRDADIAFKQLQAKALEQGQGLVPDAFAEGIGHNEIKGMTWQQALPYINKVRPAEIQAGPLVNTSPEMQQMGLPSQAPLKQANTAQGIVTKQQGMTDIDEPTRQLLRLPPGVTKVPLTSLIRALGFMAQSTKTGFEWKDINGVMTPLPTKSVTTRGNAAATATAAPSSGGGRASGPSSAPSAPRGSGMPAPVYTDKAGYAYDPQTGETSLTTPKESHDRGYTNFRPVTQKNIDEDRQLNNRLTDVATKINRYEDSLNQPITEAERGNIAGLLGSDKFKAGVFGAEIPVDRMNQVLDVENVRGLSQAAQNRLVAYYNARESMLGYQRVLAGSARSSDQQLGLNLGALPSPVMPDSFGKEGIRQFKENIPIAGRGLPRMPGIPTAGDVLSPKVTFKEGNDTYQVPASRVEAFRKKHPQAVAGGR